MKKLFILMTLFVITMSVFAQSRLGYTKNEIRAEYGERVVFDMYMSEYQMHIIKVALTYSEVWYTFDSNGKVNQTLLVPFTQDLLDYLCEKYNKEYLYIGNDVWTKRLDQYSIMKISITHWSKGLGKVVLFTYE